MKLVRLPLDCIVNLDTLSHADYSPAKPDTIPPLEARISLSLTGNHAHYQIEYIGDDAERIWAYLVDQSCVIV